jgi:hypothetical protein
VAGLTERVCFSLDPLKSTITGGREINRHCLQAAGHDGWHESRDLHGEVVHRWRWEREDDSRSLVIEQTLFTEEGV